MPFSGQKMEKTNLSNIFKISAATDGVPNMKALEMSSLLGISASITNKSKTRLVVTFQFHTAQTLDFVESGAAQMLFSNLKIDDRIFFPLDPTNDNLMISKKSTCLENHHNKITLPGDLRMRLRIRAMDNAVSRRVPASERNRRLYRHSPAQNIYLILKTSRGTQSQDMAHVLFGRTIVVDEYRKTIEGGKSDRSEAKLYHSREYYCYYPCSGGVRLQISHEPCSSGEHFRPSFGIYYHPRIDELSILSPSVFKNAILLCLPVFGFQLSQFRYMQTLVIRAAHLSARDIASLNNHSRGRQHFCYRSYECFSQTREVMTYPSKSVISTEDNLFCTELGRRQSLEVLNGMFNKACQLGKNGVQAPRITICLEDF
ncbi:uncharacterized protein Bfra_007570 [Botrytis fragariae]|uniref:Uncharacterized protein n=1 Tax=Botrytis fragariae TaxID=1964551 RepID=A0A8H6AP19_9HELO|nr:uncharacterized protein Bfra_007570 [Botrytis fragariae]KAF5871057.1 hypothetical protein Bfra_007570 [Botrytis fragariae]